MFRTQPIFPGRAYNFLADYFKRSNLEEILREYLFICNKNKMHIGCGAQLAERKLGRWNIRENS